jgi:hypothetical protein
MKSNICVIKRGGLGLENILREVEKVTDYNSLDQKEALRLRLLAEELVGMLPELVKNFEGCFWLQNNEKQYELRAELSVDSLSKEEKEQLISVSASKKNAAASGFMGKIRDIAENMLLFSDDPSRISFFESEYIYGYDFADVHFSYAWSMDSCMERQPQKEKKLENEWDQLEASIVAKLADDVVVGVRGKKVEIIIKKNF